MPNQIDLLRMKDILVAKVDTECLFNACLIRCRALSPMLSARSIREISTPWRPVDRNGSEFFFTVRYHGFSKILRLHYSAKMLAAFTACAYIFTSVRI